MDKFSLMTTQQIINHLDNNSLSKTTHAFSRTKRFKTANPEYYRFDHRCKEAFYTNISCLSRKKFSIGKAKRSDFTIKTEPTPGV